MKDNHIFNLRFRDRIGLAAVVVTGAVFMILRFGEFPVGAGMDDAYYIEMARSLATGLGPVIHLNGIGMDWRPGIFPLGFPLLLSPLALLIPTSVQVFKLVPMLSLAGLVPVCLLLARSANLRCRTALTALVCLNPWTIAYSTRVFSDLPFAFVSLAAVLLFLDTADVPRIIRPRFAALVTVTAAAIMIRSIGLALPVAMFAYWILHKRWQRALLLVAGVGAALLPHAFASRDSGGGLITRGYLQQVFTGDGTFGSRFALMADNLVGYLKELPTLLLPVWGNPLENLAARANLGAVYGPLQLFLGTVLAGGVVWGLIMTGRRNRGRARFLAIYIFVYGAVLLNFSGYPSGVQIRLLLPILPLLFLALLEILDQPTAIRRPMIFLPAVFLLLSMALVHNVYRTSRPLASTPDPGGKMVADPGLGAEWVRDNTGSEDLVMARWPLRQHIHFLRPVVGFGAIGRKELDQRIERFGVDYIFLGPGESNAAMAEMFGILDADPGGFEPVYRDWRAGVMIFKVVKSP
ncbi:MAG: hypothetical protein KAH56_00600 [Candidatus Krumholzibacteria bacterium]|nr:hypothetical protein [Candidatus Krumholzibacteria bacterium]